MNNSFVFYASFYEALSELDDADRLAAYDAICRYSLTGEEPETSGIVRAVFLLMRPVIDANNERRANGSKGGRPSKKPMVSENDANEKPMDSENAQNEKPYEDEDVDEDVDEDKRERVRERKPARPERHKYGMYRNVLLSDDQMEKLKAEIPNYLSYIELVSEYVAKTGKGYKDYLAAIRSWYRKDQQEGKNRAAPQRTNSFMNFPERDDYNYEELGKILNFKPV